MRRRPYLTVSRTGRVSAYSGNKAGATQVPVSAARREEDVEEVAQLVARSFAFGHGRRASRSGSVALRLTSHVSGEPARGPVGTRSGYDV